MLKCVNVRHVLLMRKGERKSCFLPKKNLLRSPVHFGNSSVENTQEMAECDRGTAREPVPTMRSCSYNGAHTLLYRIETSLFSLDLRS